MDRASVGYITKTEPFRSSSLGDVDLPPVSPSSCRPSPVTVGGWAVTFHTEILISIGIQIELVNFKIFFKICTYISCDSFHPIKKECCSLMTKTSVFPIDLRDGQIHFPKFEITSFHQYFLPLVIILSLNWPFLTTSPLHSPLAVFFY